jgi:hypothetical protein
VAKPPIDHKYPKGLIQQKPRKLTDEPARPYKLCLPDKENQERNIEGLPQKLKQKLQRM